MECCCNPPMGQPAMCYPSEVQYERWKKRSNEMGYHSVSQWMIDMIEAGTKKFEVDVTADETNRELREQRNDLQQQIEGYRQRVTELENQLHNTERQQIIEFVEEEEEAEYEAIVRKIGDDVPLRVQQQLDALEGSELAKENGLYVVRR